MVICLLSLVLLLTDCSNSELALHVLVNSGLLKCAIRFDVFPLLAEAVFSHILQVASSCFMAASSFNPKHFHIIFWLR